MEVFAAMLFIVAFGLWHALYSLFVTDLGFVPLLTLLAETFMLIELNVVLKVKETPNVVENPAVHTLQLQYRICHKLSDIGLYLSIHVVQLVS